MAQHLFFPVLAAVNTSANQFLNLEEMVTEYRKPDQLGLYRRQKLHEYFFGLAVSTVTAAGFPSRSGGAPLFCTSCLGIRDRQRQCLSVTICSRMRHGTKDNWQRTEETQTADIPRPHRVSGFCHAGLRHSDLLLGLLGGDWPVRTPAEPCIAYAALIRVLKLSKIQKFVGALTTLSPSLQGLPLPGSRVDVGDLQYRDQPPFRRLAHIVSVQQLVFRCVSAVLTARPFSRPAVR